MVDSKHLHESMNPIALFRLMKYKFRFGFEHPDYFYSDGLIVFVGPQGSGKTLSAVNYVYRLLADYPDSILVTNILLRDYPFDNVRVFPFVNNDDFAKYSNGEKGVIFLVDEIQLYLNSLESKNINLDVVAQIAQQRKQRKHIVATSQVFGRLAKPLREQFTSVFLCRGLGGVLQSNAWIDRDSIQDTDDTSAGVQGKVRRRFFWWRSPDMFERYDTSYVIQRGKFIGNELKKEVYAIGSNRTVSG